MKAQELRDKSVDELGEELLRLRKEEFSLRMQFASGQLGQFFVPVAYRNNVKGLIKSPVQFFWNMSVE